MFLFFQIVNYDVAKRMRELILRFIILFIVFQPFTSIQAAFNIETSSPLQYAEESLVQSDYQDGNVLLSSASDTLDIRFKAGFGLSNDRRYIRIDLINGAFNSVFPSSGVASDVLYDSTISAGGAIGEEYIIIEVSASPAVGPDTEFTLENNSFLLYDINKPLTVVYSLFDSVTAAVYQQESLYSLQGTFLKFIDSFGTKFTYSFSHNVGFGQDFLRFNPTFRSPSTFALGDATESVASVGKVLLSQLILDDVLLPSTSEQITDFRLLLPSINTDKDIVTISGDFSTARYFLNEDDNCAGASVELAEYSNSRTISISLDELVDFPVFCIAAESNEIAIQRSAYQIDLGIGIESTLLGEVVYDAATIDLPYITDYSGYRQRIILVNHAGYDVRYFTEFTSEQEVIDNYIVNDLAKGVIPAGSTLKLNANDLVTISEGVPTRVSARILVDAKPKDISAAIQILSLGSSLPPQTNVLQVIEY